VITTQLSLYFFSLLVTLASASELDPQKIITAAIEREVRKECSTCRVSFQVTNPKLLEDVAVPDKVLADHWKGQTNLILFLGAEKRIVTADIRWFDQVVIAQDNIKIGDDLNEKNMLVQEMEVTYLQTAYARDLAGIKGLVSRKLFRRGQILDESQLKKPIVVRFGQPLKLRLHEQGLVLTLDARAQGAGAIGEDIPVFIPQTQKRIQARIVGAGQVEIR
jgi:flagella basal body P-ring formation protein FlgA